MENFTSLENSEVSDQTILSGLGSQRLDLSIDTVNCREPNAASTAVNYVRQREDYLQACFEKENDYFKCPENLFPDLRPTSEKEILKDVTLLRNIPDEFVDLKEVTLNLNKELTHTPETAVIGNITNDSSSSNLFPSSSILSQSKLLSFSDNDEVDLKTDSSKLLGLPSYLIGGQNKTVYESQIATNYGEKEEMSKAPWGNESSFGFEVDNLQIGNSNSVWQVPCKEKRSSEINFPFTSAVNENRANPFDEEDVRQEEELSSFEFHKIDSRELSLDEEKVLKQDSYFMGNSFAYASSKSEFSGLINPDDISLKSSLWDIGSDVTNQKEKLNIEDIFKAKSTKPNFGYDVDKAFYLENEVEKPFETPLSLFSTEDTLTARVSNPVTITTSHNRLFNLESDSGRSPKTESSISTNEKDSSLSFDTIQEIIKKISLANDPQELIKQFSEPYRDDNTLESFSESTAEILEIKKYKERLSRIIFKDDPPPQGSSYASFANVMDSGIVRNIDKSASNRLVEVSKNIPEYFEQTNLGQLRIVKDAIQTDNSYQLPASSGWPMDDKQNFSMPIKDTNLNKDTCFIGPIEGNVDHGHVSKIALTGVKTDIEYQIKNPTSELLRLSVKQLDIYVTCDNEEKVDFGLVPECCVVSKSVLIVNRSKHPIPVFVSLKPICDLNEMLTWIDNNPAIKLVSSSLAASEIDAESALSFLVQLNAPSVDVLRNILQSGQNSGLYEVESSLEVTLDSPFNSTFVLSEIPVKIRIGEVQLRTQRSVLPLKVESFGGQIGSCMCTLRNKSLFPLDLSVKLSDHEQFLHVCPESLSIPSQEDATIEIRFLPPKNFPIPNIEAKLLVLVEPEGMQMDLPLVASLTRISKPKDPIPIPVTTVEDCSSRNQVLITKPVNILTNGLHCMFGTIPVGESKSYKFILQNGWSEYPLVLQICILKNDVFYFSELDDVSRVLSKEVTLEPKEKINLMINFAPTKREFYLGSLICIYKNTEGKTSFPLYGFGGSGELILKYGKTHLSHSEEIPFGEIILNVPSLMKLTATNTGSRYLFVKFQTVPDENCDEPFSPSDICVQPQLMILGPGETKEVVVMCMNSRTIMERTMEKFGILKVIYGDEILRRRFRSHNDSKLKMKKINNNRLLRVNFHEEIALEKDEEDDGECPLLSDDPITFYNCCRILNIPLCGDIHENEVSTTMIDAGVDATTMKSFMIKNREKLPINVKGKEVSNLNPGFSDQVSSNSIEFHVIPLNLMLKTSQKFPIEVTVINRSDKDQVLEVSCKDSYLSINPMESTVASKSFTVFKVTLITANLPRNVPKVIRTSLHILGPNYQQRVNVIIEIDSSFNNEKFSQPSKIPLYSQKQHEVKVASVLPLQNTKVPEKYVQNFPHIEQRNENEPRLEVTEDITFPDTKISKESCAKISMTNYGSDPQKVKVYILGKHFRIRHEIITVNGKCTVSMPVYFAPRIKGEIVDFIKVQILSNQHTHIVRLSGKCF